MEASLSAAVHFISPVSQDHRVLNNYGYSSKGQKTKNKKKKILHLITSDLFPSIVLLHLRWHFYFLFFS